MRYKPRRCTTLVLYLLLAAGLPMGALGQECTVRQITDTTLEELGFFSSPSIDASGNRIGFLLWDMAPDGSVDGQYIRLYEVGSGVQQIAAGVVPALSADGAYLAFNSREDLVPPLNADGHLEIFLYGVESGTFVQVTDIPQNHIAFAPRISGDGQRIAFLSDADLEPGSNADGNLELFLVDVPSGSYTQITDTAGPHTLKGWSLDGDGGRVAFVSSGDLVPGANSDGNPELFLFDVATSGLVQLTDTTGVDTEGPVLSGDGDLLVITSEALLDPQGGTAGPEQIYLYHVPRGIFTQVVDGVSKPSPTLSADGTHIAYRRFGELLLYEVRSGITRLAVATAGAGFTEPSLNGDGSRIAFVSNGDLVPGENEDGNNELFLASCPTVAMYLNEGRFRVAAQWQTPRGEAGTGHPVQLTDDSGYLWFFNAENIELVVKVLNACGIPGFDNFWAFIAGLTNVEVTITVTDTVAQEEKVYSNPLGVKFDTILDTAAFDTCDVPGIRGETPPKR